MIYIYMIYIYRYIYYVRISSNQLVEHKDWSDSTSIINRSLLSRSYGAAWAIFKTSCRLSSLYTGCAIVIGVPTMYCDNHQYIYICIG